MTRSEDDLEPLLRARRPLFRDASQGGGLEPGDHLDSLIIERARTALRAPQPMPFYRGTRWAVPVALAATVVMSFTLLLYTREGAPRAPAARSAVPAADAAPVVDAATQAAPAADAEKSAPLAEPSVAPAATRRQRSVAIPPATAAPAPAFAPSPPPLSAAMPAAAPAPADSQRAANAAESISRAELGATSANAMAARDTVTRQDAESKTSELTRIRDNPEDWWHYIVDLRANGRQVDASTEWKKLHFRFPDFIPPPNAQ